MRHLRAAAFAQCLILLICSLAGCGRGNGRTVTLVCSGDTGYYWTNIAEGARQAAMDYHLDLRVRTLAGEGLEEALYDEHEQGARVALVAAKRQHIPASPFLNPLDFGTINCEMPSSTVPIVEVRCNDFYFARDMANTLKKDIGLQIQVLLITDEEEYHPDDQWEGNLRNEAGMGGITFVGRVYAGGDPGAAYLGAREALDEYPELRAILCQSEAATVGALRALRETPGKATILGRDINDEIAQGIQQGYVYCTYLVNAYAMGYLAVENAARRIDKAPVDARRGVDAVFINRDNLFSREISTLVFPVR